MAAYINRTISLVAGNSHSPLDTHSNAIAVAENRDSPLQIFVKAKKKINDIFVEIEAYLKDAVIFMEKQKSNEQVITKEETSQVEGFVNKVRGIRDVLSRDHMKVAFFGRTSNGKSSVINAMLHDKILPSGIGHTTNCFLQVEGSENGESYLVTEDSNERRNVQSVGQLAHALCKEKLNESQLVRIYWPKDKCLLLRDDVVLVDSPGIDVSPNLDEWIDRHCLDADVFVLVANAESTLMLTEKNFFHKVSTRLSKPNIFILNNRWDASANELEFLDQVRTQHLERALDFLVKELKVCTTKEAQDRIFFVSAKEALQARLQEAKGQPLHSGALAEGFQSRYFEFTDFERKFEECISKSAVKTKFEQHNQRGRHIANEMASLLEGVYERAQKKRDERLSEKRQLQERLNYTEQQLIVLTKKMKDKIQRMVEEVEQKVSTALSEEIRRLSVLVDEFSVPFHPEPLVLNVYKKELHSHVESGLGSNLRARLSTALSMNIEANQREMTENMSQLLPDAKRHLASSLALPRREPFEILYRLNCDNLCADFREDLEFRFSWGLTCLIHRFANISRDNSGQNVHRKLNYSNHRTLSNDLSQGENGHPSTVVAIPSQNSLSSFAQEWSLPSKMALATVGSQGTMGGLLLAGFLLKTVGWRIIVASGAIYGCLYMYERLTWTTKAKEKTLKQQYVAHATKKLRLIVDLTSANCSHQVQQELSSTFARLCQLLDEESAEMIAEVKKLELEVKQLEEAASSAKILRNKANYVDKELQLFDDAYLKTYR